MQTDNTVTISEFGLIGWDEEPASKFLSAKIDKAHYLELEEFAKSDAGKEVLQFARNGKFLQARSYVGTIQTKSGLTLEILPKTVAKDSETLREVKIKTSREIFMQLLHLLHKLPSYKQIDSVNLERLKNISIFEIYIFMFLKEVELIIKRGIKSDYIEQEGNLFYMKGKLLINEQIRRNTVHEERFYMAYDEYSQNRAENKLIKSTLLLLTNLSTDFTNKRLIRQHLEHMHQIQPSTNYDKDFRSCKKGRGMEHYYHAMIWAKVFLKKESFSSFSGDTIAFSILYPMEKLFEAFVEWWLVNLVKKCPSYQVQAQNGETNFVQGLFGVRPDYLIKNNNDKVLCVADAKWKLIGSNTESSEKLSFSQADFYQLFAYKHIFSDKKDNQQNNIALRLYYPKTEYLATSQVFKYFDGQKLIVVPLDIKEELKNYGVLTARYAWLDENL